MAQIAVLGCGNIGSAIVQGLVKNDENMTQSIIATRRTISKLKFLDGIGVELTSNNVEAVDRSKYIIIAVKPYKVEEVIDEIKPHLNENHILISLASEVSLEALKNFSKMDIPHFRVMPNTAAEIQESLTCISYDDNASDYEIIEVENLFKSIGQTVVIEENLMEAATILGACGIAYVLRFIRAMIQGGVQIGFDANTATQITTQTVKGAAELLLQKKNHPESEIDKVTTPKGCTITGLNEMEHQGFSSSLIKGITKSFEKIDSSTHNT